MLFGYLHMPQFGYRILPGFGLWALDRLLRLLRLIYLNLPLLTSSSGTRTTLTGEIVSGDTVRLTVRLQKKIDFRAGQHVYLMVPSVSRFPLEAHPFTPASISGSLSSSSDENEKGVHEETDGGKTLVFIMRSRDGFTKKMFNFIQSQEQIGGEEARRGIPALVDGPYGCPGRRTLWNSTCVLIAGAFYHFSPAC